MRKDKFRPAGTVLPAFVGSFLNYSDGVNSGSTYRSLDIRLRIAVR